MLMHVYVMNLIQLFLYNVYILIFWLFIVELFLFLKNLTLFIAFFI